MYAENKSTFEHGAFRFYVNAFYIRIKIYLVFYKRDGGDDGNRTRSENWSSHTATEKLRATFTLRPHLVNQNITFIRIKTKVSIKLFLLICYLFLWFLNNIIKKLVFIC